MKERHIGLISVGVIMLSSLMTVGYLSWQHVGEDLYGMIHAGLSFGNKLDRGGLDHVPDVDTAIQKTIRRLTARLAELRFPGLPQRGMVDFEMLGYELPKNGSEQADAGDNAFNEYGFSSIKRQTISMTYLSEGIRYAVVNGKLYKEGEALNDDLKIQTIEPRKVLIVGRASAKWVPISSPIRERTGRSVSSGAPTASATQQAKKGKADQSKSAMEQITQGLGAIKNYADILKSLEERD